MLRTPSNDGDFDPKLDAVPEASDGPTSLSFHIFALPHPGLCLPKLHCIIPAALQNQAAIYSIVKLCRIGGQMNVHLLPITKQKPPFAARQSMDCKIVAVYLKDIAGVVVNVHSALPEDRAQRAGWWSGMPQKMEVLSRSFFMPKATSFVSA